GACRRCATTSATCATSRPRARRASGPPRRPCGGRTTARRSSSRACGASCTRSGLPPTLERDARLGRGARARVELEPEAVGEAGQVIEDAHHVRHLEARTVVEAEGAQRPPVLLDHARR